MNQLDANIVVFMTYAIMKLLSLNELPNTQNITLILNFIAKLLFEFF